MLALFFAILLAKASDSVDVCSAPTEEHTEHGLLTKLHEIREHNIIKSTLQHIKDAVHDWNEAKPILHGIKSLKHMDLSNITDGMVEDVIEKLLGGPLDKTVGKELNVCADEDSLCYGQDITIDDTGLASAFTWFGASLLTKINLKSGIPTFKDMIVPVAQEDQQCEPITQAWTGVYWCKIDEDKMDKIKLTAPALKFTTIFANPHKFPFQDSNKKATPEQQAEFAQRIFNVYKVPTFHYPYGEDEAACERMAFSGMASHRLALVPSDDSLVQVDMNFMNVLEVREGFAKWGGAAFFDAKSRKIAYIEYDRKVVRPGDEDWKWTMFAWRSAVFLGTTAVDHLLGLHFLIGEQQTVASRQALPPEHPLRRFIKPFTHGTEFVNFNAAYQLFPEYAALHRATSLSKEGLNLAISIATWSLNLEDKEFYKKKSKSLVKITDGLDTHHTDSLKFFSIIEKFVHRFMELYYPTQEALEADKHMRDWWLMSSLGKSTTNTNFVVEAVENYLTLFVFQVTAYHQHVGTVGDFTSNLGLATFKLRHGETEGDLAYMFQGGAIAVSTGLPMVSLMNFDIRESKLYEGLSKEKELTENFDKMTDRLKKLDWEIKEDNEKNRPDNPCLSFLPSRTGISISV